MEKKNSIGVDLGGTKVKFGIVTQEGEVLKELVLPTLANEGVDKSLNQIKKGIRELLEESDRSTILGIGIGAPGVVCLKQGTVENPPNLCGWDRVHLGKIMQDEFSLPVFVENDANAAAIGELIYGNAKDVESFIMVTLGTGVGGGIIYKRKLFRGDTGAAGEIGHITIDSNGPKCKCGSYGCLETYLGNNYIIENVRKELKNNKESLIYKLTDNNLSNLTPKIIHEAALLKDNFSKKVIERLGETLGYGLASIVNVFDITNIVIGGGVAGFGEPLLKATEESIKSRVLKSLSDRVKVIKSSLGNKAGTEGAASLVFYS
ncbi:MAG: hypothetical protein CR986_08155 [Ignavibacteriae bacterium]|nr:MAG: hypothetical protein CR986_08155 [Ignavibacteriota bacterium]